MSRLGLILALALSFGLLLAPGATSRGLDTTVPQLLEPANGAVHVAGTPIVFKASTHPADRLWLHVSRSPNPVEECGQIDSDIRTYSMTPTVEDASVYDVRPENYTFEGYWLVTPGTYYWQVFRIEYSDANGCVPSEVRSLVVQAAPKPPQTTTTTTRTTTTTPKPKPKPKPKALPLGQARLAGDFNVRYRLTSTRSFDEKVGSSGDFSWSFRPKCSRGACSVRVDLDGDGSFTLSRAGATYHGSGSARLTSCLMAPVWGPTTIRIAVKHAAWIEGKWLATQWKGTLAHSWSSHGACASGSFTASLGGYADL
ncbi:MAG: hypothetical protein ACXVY8_03305 [Gaiellaceae bacterium]